MLGVVSWRCHWIVFDAANTGVCEFNGVLAVNGTAVGQGSVKMCEIQQG